MVRRPVLHFTQFRTFARLLLIAIVVTVSPLAVFGQIVGTASMSGTLTPATPVLGGDFQLQIAVNLTGVTNGGNPARLGGHQVRVLFDETKVQFVSASAAGTTFDSATATNPATANANGELLVNGTDTTPTSGNVVIVNLTFDAIATGATSFDISPASGTSIQTGLENGGPRSIPTNGTTKNFTILAAPAAPTGLIPVDNATDVPVATTLSWNASAGATNYDVYLGTSTNPGFYTNTAGTSVNVSLSAGTTYRWRVVAKNGAGSASSVTQRFTTAGEDGPSCNGVSFVSPTVDTAVVEAGVEYRISWTGDADATDYVVEEATNPDFNPKTSIIVTAPTTEAFFTHTPDQSTTYYYRVAGRNKAGSCNVSGPFNSQPVQVLVEVSQILKRYIASVGSGAGDKGSFFRTGMQIYNPTELPISGVIRFHPQGIAGTDADPSMEYSLLPGQGLAYDDIVVSLGQVGLGSLDFVSEEGFPVVVTRVFNDAGEEGTTGIFEDLLTPEDALIMGDTAVLVAPANVLKARMNVGIRTLSEGATIEFTLKTKDGATLHSFTQTYGPNFFDQKTDKVFLNYPMGVLDSDVVIVKVTAGSAFVYASITDNLTNDPAMQLGRPINR